MPMQEDRPQPLEDEDDIDVADVGGIMENAAAPVAGRKARMGFIRRDNIANPYFAWLGFCLACKL